MFIFEPFRRHPREHAGKSYWEHSFFAMAISIRLLASSISFMIHSVLPFVPIPRILNLGCTIEFMEEKNNKVKKVT